MRDTSSRAAAVEAVSPFVGDSVVLAKDLLP